MTFQFAELDKHNPMQFQFCPPLMLASFQTALWLAHKDRLNTAYADGHVSLMTPWELKMSPNATTCFWTGSFQIFVF